MDSFCSQFEDVLQGNPDDALFEAATDFIIASPELQLNKRLALRFLRWFPHYYFLFDSGIRADADVARVLITRSRGSVFSTLPLCVRETPELACLAWLLNPMVAHAIPFRLRRSLCADPGMARALCHSFPQCRLSAKSIKYIPRAAFRAYSREKLTDRAAFMAYLRALHRRNINLHVDLNTQVADFLGLALERRPKYSWDARLYWIRTLKRGAV